MRAFHDFIPSLRIANWTPALIRKHLLKQETETIESLCRLMMESDGEYSSLLLAERILNAYEKLDDNERLSFFELLQQDYDVDAEQIKSCADDYQQTPDAVNLKRLGAAAEPRRQELLRRINLATSGTRRLVKMREHLLVLIAEHPGLKKIDTDFHHLFNAWFNRAFLTMQPIDWTTPAHILEKIIAYEAVHEIKSWDELRSRLQPEDRHCFAFFHPSMEDEPLVFVVVALADHIPASIGEILQRDEAAVVVDELDCAIFYSISNCHSGLAGVSFGNFLIKQVATSLKLRFPELKKFSTLSPAPGFAAWLKKRAEKDSDVASLLQQFDSDADAPLRDRVEGLAATYFLEQKNRRGEPLDPVARFHLKNGAILKRINILGDTSPKGMQQSLGLMVNYVYDLSRVEENHEEYVKNNKVISNSRVRKLLKKNPTSSEDE